MCLLILGVGVAVIFLPQVLPSDQCSEVYRRYAGAQDIDATYLMDYRVNDIMTTAVTVLEAKTDSAWAVLMKDFNISTPPPEALAFLGQDSNDVTFRRVSRDDYSMLGAGDAQDYLLLAVQEYRHILSIIPIENEEEALAIHYKKIVEIKK